MGWAPPWLPARGGGSADDVTRADVGSGVEQVDGAVAVLCAQYEELVLERGEVLGSEVDRADDGTAQQLRSAVVGDLSNRVTNSWETN